MSNKVKKNHPDDITRKELIDRLGWPSRTFTERFAKFLNFYGISKDHFTYDVFETPKERLKRLSSNNEMADKEEIRKIRIDYRYKDLLFILLKAFEEHPFYRDNYDEKTISLDRVIAYNECLISLIEALPDALRYRTMSHPTYYRTVNQLPAMKKMSEKIHQFLAASVLAPKQVRLQVWEEMFDFIDYMIFRTFDLSVKYQQEEQELTENKKTKAQKNNQQLKVAPNKAYQDMLTELFDGRANQAKPDSDLPCDTLDEYIAMLLKSYIFIIDQLEGDPKFAIEAINTFQVSKQLAEVAYDAVSKMLSSNVEDVKDAEMERWKQEVRDYAEKAKMPFSSVVSLKDGIKEIWDQFKDNAECKFDRKHYKGFLEFCDQVEKTAHQGDYLLKKIVNEPTLEILRTKK